MRKNFTILLLVVLCSISLVSAAPSLILPSSLSLGTYSRNTTSISTFTITNNGNVTLTSVTPQITPVSGFAVRFNNTGFNLPVNASATIKVNTSISVDAPSGNISIGNINIQTAEFTSSSFPMYAKVSGGLSIHDLDVTLTTRLGEVETDTDVMNSNKLDFGKDDEIGPGSILEFDFRIENLFTDNDDIDIDDVSVKVTILEIDEEEDLDEETDTYDLKPEEIEDMGVIFEIPMKVNTGTYDVIIEVEGEDERGISHTIEWTIEFDVEKEKYDFYIDTASLTKDTVTCDSRDTSLKLEVWNIGSREQDDVLIEAKNSAIGLSYSDDDVSLSSDAYDDDSEWDKTIPISIPEDVKAGTYPIDVNVYYQGTVILVSEKVDLKVEACASEEPEEEQPPEEEEEDTEEAVEVKDFLTCLDAGYTIMESYPRQCVTPQGMTFTENVQVIDDTQGTVTAPVIEEEITETEEGRPVSPVQLMMILMLITVVIAAGIAVTVVFYKPR